MGAGVEPRRIVHVRHAKIRAERLMEWFAVSARDLPWRRTRDPYGIWVSEIMLQQTQVKTVIPYWERWMRELPDVESLGRASEERVLKLWEGLGYYRRARHLQAGARAILERHGGRFPEGEAEILALPGIGRYTAGAIGSIAFGRPVPILDGNVIRVLTRWEALGGDPKGKALNERLWRDAEAVVAAAFGTGAADASSRLNQALMELGATVCTPRAPGCPRCPVLRWCAAGKAGKAEAYPETAKRAETTRREYLVVVARSGNRYRVGQRPAGAVNGGLWEFPGEERAATGMPDEAEVWSVARRLHGRGVEGCVALGVVRHSITRYRITQRVYLGTLEGPPDRSGGAGEWRTLEELEGLAFSSAHRRILGLVIGAGFRRMAGRT